MAASIVRIIALAVVFLLMAVSGILADEGLSPASPVSRQLQRSIASFLIGYAWDYDSGYGMSWTIRGMSFFWESPFYYGMGSISGVFFSTEESFTDTCLFAGWNGPIGGGAELDASLGFVVAGARIVPSDGRLEYRAEGPAIMPSLGLSIPVLEGADVMISASPLIRPYDLKSGAWGLSRSYLVLSASVRIKQRLLVEKKSWDWDA
jgi:hypothetical protein